MFGKLISAIALAAALATAAAGPAAAADAKPLRIGVEGSYPPFSAISPDGSLSGFDIDIAKALCAEMKVECTLVQQEWDGMIPALNARKFDAIVASMTITEDRKKVVDFTDPYYDVPSRWVAKAGAFTDTTPETLKGKTIAVLRNSPRAQWLAARYPDSDLLLAGKEPEFYLELVAGRADIAFGSSVVSNESFLKTPQGEGYAAVGDPVRLEAQGGAVGIALRKADTDLRDRLNAALKAIRADGTYAAIQKRYFDFDISGS